MAILLKGFQTRRMIEPKSKQDGDDIPSLKQSNTNVLG